MSPGEARLKALPGGWPSAAALPGLAAKAAGSLAGSLWPLVVVAVAWELFARSGRVPRVLAPTIGDVWSAMVRGAADGTLFLHVGSTLYRLLGGFVLAAIVGIAIGMTMARWSICERFWLPIVSVLMPIPGLAWVPIFILWFGLGEVPTVLLVAFVSCLPIILSVWTGIRGTNPIWLRAAQSMNATGVVLFWKVILPASLPFVLTGCRIGLARSWRAVVAGEYIANTMYGLGWVIFNSIAYLQSDVMFASIILIGLTGLLVEKVLFQAIEQRTVVRWGMLHDAGAA